MKESFECSQIELVFLVPDNFHEMQVTGFPFQSEFRHVLKSRRYTITTCASFNNELLCIDVL